MEHYDKHNIVTDAQHGFRPDHSCESQLITTTQDLAKSIDNREQVDQWSSTFQKHSTEAHTNYYF